MLRYAMHGNEGPRQKSAGHSGVQGQARHKARRGLAASQADIAPRIHLELAKVPQIFIHEQARAEPFNFSLKVYQV